MQPRFVQSDGELSKILGCICEEDAYNIQSDLDNSRVSDETVIRSRATGNDESNDTLLTTGTNALR